MTFKTSYGNYEFMVNLPFRLTNAPTAFMTLMNSLFQKYLGNFVLVFMDDILVYSKSKTKHLEHLKDYIWSLENEPIICQNEQIHEFGAPQVDYLRHVVLNKGIIADPKNIKVM
jgi:hypothetical protein